MLGSTRRHLGLFVCALVVAACGGSTPQPKTEDAARTEAPRPRRGAGLGVSQELGSIDQHAVEQTFAKLGRKLEVCHAQGRDRVEYLAGDVQVFLRIDTSGRVKYGYFEESTLGDRATEKCLLDLFAATTWPTPEGGEAEVRNGFGWPSGGERPPTPWGAEKAMLAVEADVSVKKSVASCKAGTTGDFIVTAYVEPREAEAGAGKGGKKGSKAAEPGGAFTAIGVAAPDKDGAEKADCIVEALRGLSLPSPGSYAAKVTFPL